jgi:hypothetical protein
MVCLLVPLLLKTECWGIIWSPQRFSQLFPLYFACNVSAIILWVYMYILYYYSVIFSLYLEAHNTEVICWDVCSKRLIFKLRSDMELLA